MRTSVITLSAKNARLFAAVTVTAALAGGVQFLTTGPAWAYEGPYKAANPIISIEAQQRHQTGAPTADFAQARPLTPAAGSSTETGAEFANAGRPASEASSPTLALPDAVSAGLLAASSVALPALGIGLLTAVRRRRTQR
ncbi:hypothetical protein GCM10010441_13100 [Kitasatospora paracochleata]|uniref:Secreted protein n=1 Tax=Kitasatospora paracochleata TaxID=58354 RepID=A0ABT1JAX2_9ACTN|nr:hypothetical protein [Kitasatospora paracochleata]MCP2314590.1 hypothetical protein [Kitasatospora paracochleata]